MTGGRELPGASPFAGDDGAVPAALATALALTDPVDRLAGVVEALREVRVLVPVLARLDERAEPAHADAPAGGTSAHAALVTVRAPDGRAALPVFSGLQAMRRWDAQARPVPVQGRRAAIAAGAEADSLLVLDPAGPTTTVVGRPAVRAVALGEPWQPAARNPDVLAQAQHALADVPGVVGVALEPGESAEVSLVVALSPHVDGAAVVARSQQALAAAPGLVDLVDSVALRPAHAV